MSRKPHFRRGLRARAVWLFALATVAAVTVLTAQPAEAKDKDKPPKVTEWKFMEQPGVGQPCVDWEAEDSIEIKIDSTTASIIEFGTPVEPDWTEEDFTIYDAAGNPHYIGGTRWLRMPVVHTTSSGKQTLKHIYWLLQDVDGDGQLDAPKQGMKAPSGPEGDVMHFATALTRMAVPTNPDIGGKWYVVPSNGTYEEVCIAIGLFKD